MSQHSWWPRLRILAPFVLATAVTVVAAAAMLVLDSLEAQRRSEAEHRRVVNELSTIRARLEYALTAPLLLTRGIVAQIVAHGDISVAEFERTAAVLLAGTRNIRNFAFSRGTVIQGVYPLKGNEAALGADYRNQPHQWEAVERAITTRQPVVAGPVRLIQGGMALVGRAPVFLSEPGGDRYFGQVSVVVDIPGVFADAGLEGGELPLSVAIRGRDGLGAAGGNIFGDDAVFAVQPVEMDVLLPYGNWRLAGIPRGGWSTASATELRLIRLLGWSLVAFVAIASFGTALHVVEQRRTRHRLAESEQRYRSLSAELETRVEERTRDLIDAMAEAQASDRAKTTFLANMSHELRTPLNAIIGFSDTIRNDLFGTCQSPCRASVGDIYDAGHHLLDLINDILDLAKVDAAALRITKETCRVAEVVQAAVAMVRDSAAQAGVTLTIRQDDPGLVHLLDRRRALQMLVNLLSNAIKFTPRHATVTVAAEVEGGGWLRLSVADTGVGIAAEDLEQVLKPFNRGSHYIRHPHEGNGIGLPLTRRLAELHGGELLLRSELGRGTTVTLRFPPD